MKIFGGVVIFFLIASCIKMIVATEHYFDCDVYTNEESTPTEHTYCVRDSQENKSYCKTWDCETPSCPTEEQIHVTQQDCPFCPDTCVDGGRIFDVGQNFLCVDGSNSCLCAATGAVISTRKGTNKELLCNATISEK